MCHVTKYSTIRGVFRGGYKGVCQGLLLNRHLESGVDPGNEGGSSPTRHLESGVDPGNEVGLGLTQA